MKKSLVLLVLFCIIFAFGCQKKAITKTDAQQMEQDIASQRDRQGIEDQKIASLDEDISSRYLEETKGMFEDILFDYDKYAVKSQYRSTLQSISAWMTKNGGATLSIEGHCDERGTNEYNLALGDRRAKAVKDYLVSLGVPSSKIEILSYGEEKPLCTQQAESCWSRNRRAHFVILTK
ncbi:MAG: peptidoglycan-associated lipoprotein Pal [Nitrospiraceae bacterium]|nr:MAG: peptidoglycan-associated lipoprotein Pal [Nitrospiraceae bacterium]